MKKSIFEYSNYREYLSNWVKTQPHEGRGQMGRIAKHLNTSPVSISYIFNNKRHLSEEQAVELGEFLGFTNIESHYFLLLVQYARAGSHKLEKKILEQIEQVASEGQKLKARVPQHRELAAGQKEEFYSNWYYSAIRLLTSIEGYQDLTAIAEVTKLPRQRVREVLDFLVNSGLCTGHEGTFGMGPQRTHLDAKSPLVTRHHANWRLRSIEAMDRLSDDELFFSGPMTLSETTLKEIRKEMVELIARITKMVEPSKSEVLACVNFDLFRVLKGQD